MSQEASPFTLTAREIIPLLQNAAPLLPELEAARKDRAALLAQPQVQKTLAWTEELVKELSHMPHTGYTAFRLFVQTGDREKYETPYFARRAMLAGAALRYFLGQNEYKDPVQDLIWAICEETTWVLPAHEGTIIDLFSAETAFMLGEVLNLLGEQLDAEVRSRVRCEVEQRVFQPYLTNQRSMWWYHGHMNWNGVCNSSIAAAFLLLEPEVGRLAQALELALKGLNTFLQTGFETDGSSTEGVSYWHYGLINFIALSEMLRARTNGAIDLLDSDHMRRIAAYPAKLLLSPSHFATFSDCDEALNFNPGVITRLMERTGEHSLQSLLSPPVPTERFWRLTMMLRDMLWWDGQYHEDMPEADVYQQVGEVVRFVAHTPKDAAVVLAIKGGHNAENHNQNDIGSWILHVDRESFLVDPGRGLYSRQYFGPERYQNVFANSYGHNVPVIGGQLQKEGREYFGKILSVDLESAVRCVALELARAYPVEALDHLRREVSLTENGVALLEDTYHFTEEPLPVQEAFVTWFEVDLDGNQAVLHGGNHDLRLTVEAPEGAKFAVELLEEASHENHKPGVLRRLTVDFLPAQDLSVRVRAEVMDRSR